MKCYEMNEAPEGKDKAADVFLIWATRKYVTNTVNRNMSFKPI